MKIGLNLFSIRNLTQNKKDLTNTLTRLKKVGCDFVQFSASPVPFKELKEASKKSKMPVVLTHVPYKRVISDLPNLIKEHQMVNCAYIGVGMLDKEIYLNEKQLKTTIKQLNQSAKKLEKVNMKFFYHNHGWDYLKLSNHETIYDYMIKNAP
ncbi:MAG: hypothetical protein MJ199_00440 [Bacilli bacterium]|nr:hypothetical protein [Bacilli bacterium]